MIMIMKQRGSLPYSKEQWENKNKMDLKILKLNELKVSYRGKEN